MFCFALHRGQETACIPFGTPGDTSTAARTPNGPKIRPSTANRFSLRFFRCAIMPAATMQIIDTVDSAMLSTTLICSEDTASLTPSLAQRNNPLVLCVHALRNPGQRDTAHPDRWCMGGGSLRCTVGALTTSESPLQTQVAHSCPPSRSSSASQAFTSGNSAANCPARRTRAWKVRTRRRS
jgi:hypothetical protein